MCEDIFSVSSFPRFSIGGQATGWCSQGCQAMIDTGTSLLTIPQEYMSSFLNTLGAEQNEYGEVLRIIHFKELEGRGRTILCTPSLLGSHPY